MDREGLNTGLDQELIKEMVSEFKIPMLISGGCKDLKDAAGAIKLGAWCCCKQYVYIPRVKEFLSYHRSEG